jgi:hypothetical protein
MKFYCVEYQNKEEKFYEFFQAENDIKANETMDILASYDMINQYDIFTTNIDMFNKDEIKYIIQKVLNKESFMTKKTMLGAIHHTFIKRYERYHETNLPFFYGNDYKKIGFEIVNSYHENLMEELYKEGYFTYEEQTGKYYQKGKNYTHYIMKIK